MRRRRRWLMGGVALLSTGCQTSNRESGDRPMVASVALPERFGVGHEASPPEIAAWDLDVNPRGEGLPPGSGTATRGAVVYTSKCASCHGAKGEGIAPNPKLVGATPSDFSFAEDPKAVRTIGNYWPYATTLYDYIRRSMPQTAPGSMSADETYGVIAWLLAENGIVARDAVIDATTLPKVRMPARDRFVDDDRVGGKTFR